MAIYLNGTLIAQINKVFFNGTQLSSTGKVYGNGTQVWTGGTLTLMEQVFNASGTFTMPSGVVDNQIIVGCTGGGGGGESDSDGFYSAGGSGRVVSTVTMSAGQTATVIVGAGGAGSRTFNRATAGGASSFTGATSCYGGQPSSGNSVGVSGGGKGAVRSSSPAGSSNCPAALTLKDGAVNGTTNLWTAKSYTTPVSLACDGGAGCYGPGGYYNVPPTNNSGGGSAGRSAGKGASGKVVVWYYTYE